MDFTILRALQEAADQLEIGLAVLQLSPPVRVLYVNESAAKLFGRTVAELEGGSPFDVLAPEMIEKERARLATRGLGDAPPNVFESVAQRPDGTRVAIEIATSRVKTPTALLNVTFVRDISARVDAIETRKRIEQELVRADRLASIGMMSAAVAHEINNPLAYVQLCLQYLDRELPKLLPEAAHDRVLEQVRNASHGIDRVATIVRDLRAFARSDDGEVGPVDVVTCIEQALKLVDNEVRHRAQVVRDFADVPSVQANASRLEQVFVNMLINAAQAIGTGEAEANEIRITVRTHANAVTVAISDTGPGIAPELRERIFEPFFSTKAIGVGTGLGLAVCRSIVEQLGGRIEIGEAPRGALITVTLPTHRGAAAAPPERSEDLVSAVRRRVLVVDDEPLVRRALATVLSPHHDVVLADNGRDALEQLAVHEIDVIVCDVMMPVMNGKELYEHLRVSDPARARRFVFITGGSLGNVTGYLEQTDALILYKPFELAKVLELVAIAAER